MMNRENGFVGFEYMEVTAKRGMESMYADSYENFGWEFTGSSAPEDQGGSVTMKFKWDRKLRNKAELTRLQRQFESCAREIEALEHSKATAAAIAAFTIGLIGTAFLGGAVFAGFCRLDRSVLLLSEAFAETGAEGRPPHRPEER